METLEIIDNDGDSILLNMEGVYIQIETIGNSVLISKNDAHRIIEFLQININNKKQEL